MKKRGQFPDSYTYTIVLRGLAENAELSGIASKAIAVYHSMSAPNSRVLPTIIHTNAALTVCARSLDMDALWGFAARIPEGGPGSADARTYTIILNAIRRNLLVSAPLGEGENELAQRRERGVVEGRRIWGDVVKKWRNADLVMEEELVCAMGRLLLVGSRPRDWDDVLSLVEQTMDIARLVPRLGTKERRSFPPIRAPNTPQDLRFDDDHLAPNQPPERGTEFTSLTSTGPRSTPLTFATPSNDTLSMILEACQKTIVPRAATDYWNILTDSTPSGYGVVPDAENFHHRLRILRATRDSNAATKVLTQDLRPKDLKPGTFRLALSTCARDKNNVDALKNATLLLDLMMKSLPDADPKAALRYADLAVSFPNPKPEDLVTALTHLHPVVKSLRLQLNLGTEPSLEGEPLGGAMPLRDEKKGDVVEALRRVYAVYDRLLEGKMLAGEKTKVFKGERARLAGVLRRVSGWGERGGENFAGRKWAGRVERRGWRFEREGEKLFRVGVKGDGLGEGGKWQVRRGEGRDEEGGEKREFVGGYGFKWRRVGVVTDIKDGLGA